LVNYNNGNCLYNNDTSTRCLKLGIVIFLKLKYNIKIRQTATDPKNSPYIRNFGDPKKSRAQTTIKLLFKTTLNILEIDIKPKFENLKFHPNKLTYSP
jgi:hypothetical protein